ncbi:hypothetical protein D3C81_995630 [compost metagenome]
MACAVGRCRAGDVAEVVNASQVRRIERIGGVGGGDCECEQGQGAEQTLQHGRGLEEYVVWLLSVGNMKLNVTSQG